MAEDILSPSYGEVLQVTTHDNYWHVSIYLSVFDNHLQFIPFNCKCEAIIYKKGEFHLAHMLGKSDKNERSVTTFSAKFGPFVVTQIAGLVAKRIINKCIIGRKYKQGYEYGEILLGSRVDITLPLEGITILCKKGDKLTGAKSVIATYQAPQ